MTDAAILSFSYLLIGYAFWRLVVVQTWQEQIESGDSDAAEALQQVASASTAGLIVKATVVVLWLPIGIVGLVFRFTHIVRNTPAERH